MLKAVLFDLDNTLVDRDRAFRAVVNSLAPSRQAELLALDRGGYGSVLEALNIDQETLGQMLASHIHPDPALLEALNGLGMPLGIVSNGGGGTQWRKFRAAGLEAAIRPQYVVISADVCLEKPDPAIFHLAAAKLGVASQDCLFIGDQESIDGVGARAAGMRFQLTVGALSGPALREFFR